MEISRSFGLRNFRDFIKDMYEFAGYRGKNKSSCVFLFSDNDVVMESFLEDVNNMLSAGVVPNLYTNDELQQIRDAAKREFKRENPDVTDTPDLVQEYFFNRVKDRCHLSICMSPVGESFKNYCRMFPALINNTTINWFMRWPEDALAEVAEKYLGDIDLPPEHRPALAKICSFAHLKSIDKADLMRAELKRVFYVTPTNYLEMLKSYSFILARTRSIIGKQRDKLQNGLSKLEDARIQVEEMNTMSEVKRIDVQKKTKGAEELVLEISKE